MSYEKKKKKKNQIGPNSLKLVMLDDEGMIYWKGARKMSLLFGDKDLHH